MLTTRIIPCLDVDEIGVVKGVRFRDLVRAGDPVELAGRYYEQGADEIAFLDVGASWKSRKTLLGLVREVSRAVFVPLSAGGGVGSTDDFREILRAGADKVSVCTAALKAPELLTRAASEFGSQCVVLSVDAGRTGGTWHAFAQGGRVDTGRDAVEWAVEGEKRGAGEILLNSIDRDGTGEGYDLELLARVTSAVSIPVIASGGAGGFEQVHAAITEGGADAVLLASLLHSGRAGVADIKGYLAQKGVNIR